MHNCPMVTPGTGAPHVGGLIIGAGCATVLIEGQPAATVGDVCSCIGAQDKIIGGSSRVFIGGKPAARMGDPCAHGGKVAGGCGSVLIGGSWVRKLTNKEKVKIINKAIQCCVILLENKLKLLVKYDRQTLKEFVKWFGPFTNRRRKIILKRTKKALEVCKGLGVENFEFLKVSDNERIQGYIYSTDQSYKIYLGKKFWKMERDDENSRAGVIVHEISHFRDIGKTDDFTYGQAGCLELAKHYPEEALYNADSFELFIKE